MENRTKHNCPNIAGQEKQHSRNQDFSHHFKAISEKHPSIAAERLSLMFQGRCLCENLSFAIPQGGISVLAPKDALYRSALFELLAGRLHPAAGQCLIGKYEIHHLPLEIRRQIAVLENTEHPYEVMTIGQTAVFFSGCYPRWNNEWYFGLIEEFGLSKRMKISNLANHQRTLIALTVLLARNPELLILDDWITGFDPATREIIHRSIQRFRYKSGKTTILIGHHLGLTPHLIDNLILLGHSTSLTLPTAELFDANPALLDNRTPQPGRILHRSLSPAQHADRSPSPGPAAR